jgi:hypothetical protein
VAFPQTPLDVRTELQIGGTWTDTSQETYLRDQISITRGGADEASRPDHSRATITFNNSGGKYSPRNPMGPYYGLIGRNTPVRVSVPAATRYLRLPGDAGARASTPDTAALDIAGDLDVRVDATLANWDTGTDVVDLTGKWGTAGQFSWRLTMNPAGQPDFRWSADGTNFTIITATAIVPVPSSGRLAVRCTLDADNGAAGNTVTFYTSTTTGTAGPWVQLGDPVITAGTTSVFNSTAAMEIGDLTGSSVPVPPVGKIHAAELRNGIGGTVVASPVFSAPAAGAASFADGAGRTWTMTGGAEISDRNYRFHGEISSWPPKWDVSGKDRYTPVEAAGPLRRYGAGTNVLQSTLRRRIPSDPHLVAYWPMEDEREATRAYSPLAGVAPMTVSAMNFAADDTLNGSMALPTVTGGTTFSGTVPATAAGAWRVEHVYRIDTAPAAFATTLTIASSGTARTWTLAFQAGSAKLQGFDSGGTLVVDGLFAIGSDLFGKWARQRLTLAESGGTVTWALTWLVIGGVGGGAGGTYSGTAGAVTRLSNTYAASLDGMRLGHLAVFNVAASSVFDNADAGFAAEQSHARVDRLCTEQGIPVVFPAGTGPTAAMGPQRPGTILDLLGECADADRAILFESRDVSRLALRRRTSMYNQPVTLALDYAADGHVAPPLEPVDDDQAARNDITVSRTGGTSAHAVQASGPLSVQPPPGGIGPVTGGGTYNVATDDQVPDLAGWLLHLGTWDDARYPSVHVDLSAAPALTDAASAVDIGDRITIAHPPPEAGGTGDTLDLLVQGYTETLGSYDWDIVFNCTPYGPWRPAVLDDATLGRLDTAGSQLALAATSSDTSLTVQTTTGPYWTTAPAEYPMDLRISGEVVTATACAPAISDTFTRTTSNGWGTATSGQAWSTSGGAAADYSTSGSTGRHSLTSVNVSRNTVLGPAFADFDVEASFSTSALAAGGSQFVYLTGRWTASTDFMTARLEFTTAQAVNITIRSRIAGVETQLSTAATTLTHAAGTLFRVRFTGSGTAFQARVWPASAPEPGFWHTTATDTGITAPGQTGVRSMLAAANTNTLPVTATFDDFALLNPQALTVTRATNGVTKALGAGTDVRLATPMILAL